jgi:hypothetical protein
MTMKARFSVIFSFRHAFPHFLPSKESKYYICRVLLLVSHKVLNLLTESGYCEPLNEHGVTVSGLLLSQSLCLRLWSPGIQFWPVATTSSFKFIGCPDQTTGWPLLFEALIIATISYHGPLWVYQRVNSYQTMASLID